MTVLFFLIALLLIASAIGIVAQRSPVYSALCLVMNLALVAALYAMLGAHFLAAAQIVVYTGAIMVLVLFVIMLLNLKLEEKVIPVGGYIVFSGAVVLLFLWYVIPILYTGFGEGTEVPQVKDPVLSGVSTAQIGGLLFGRYLVPFEIASVLIMVSIVAAVMLAKRIEPNEGSAPGGRR